MVHETRRPLRKRDAKLGNSCAGLPQRFSDSTVSIRGGYSKALPQCDKNDFSAYGQARSSTPFVEVRVYWRHNSGALGSAHRQRRYALSHFPTQVAEGASAIEEASCRCAIRSKMGLPEDCFPFLWIVRSLASRYAVGPIYTRVLYCNMSPSTTRDARGPCRLTHRSIHDLVNWKRISAQELSGRPIAVQPNVSVQTDS